MGPCRANSTRVRRCSQVQAIEDRLRCFRLQANARREWLQGLAQVVLYAIGVGAAACLLVALLYWKLMIGAIVAVLAGAVLFVLGIVAMEGTLGGDLFGLPFKHPNNR